MALGVTNTKIRKLLEELRSWHPGEKRYSLGELVEKFGLEPSVVEQIVRSEGTELAPLCDPDASTLDLDPNAINFALKEPDPDPSFEDRDTGVWRKKPTGEWELVED